MPIEVMLSAVLIQQFGIASQNISRDSLLDVLDDILRYICLLVIYSCDAVAR